MTIDLRTRLDEDNLEIDPHAFTNTFFVDAFPNALVSQRELIEPGATLLSGSALCIEIEGESWTTHWSNGEPRVEAGREHGLPCVRLTPTQLTEIVLDELTPMSLFTKGQLDMSEGGLGDFLNWWLVLRSALDRRPIYTPGSIFFTDTTGNALDLRRSFTIDDSTGEMARFLEQTGYLHIRGLFSEEEMNRVSREMDASLSKFHDGDGKSWWATVKGGERRLVRMQGFDQHSPATAALLRDERFLRLGRIPGDGHVLRGMEDNNIEALIKPLHVVEGISDLPWHKDCALGRHSYDCCSMTTGISVTGAGEKSGQLRSLAGSNRALIWPAIGQPGIDLPDIPLATQTGDVTLHVSCNMHMAQAPVTRERRVLYTSFALPDRSSLSRDARRKVRDARESAPINTSQDAGGVV